MQATSQLRVDELLSRLPGTVRRGHAPVAPECEGERLSTGYPEVDELLGGGLPRGRLTELVGHGSTGTTSIAQCLLAGVTAQEGYAAWVDVADAFDPASASAAGVALHRLLWVRPPDLVAAFAATEILLATGGFALVCLDTACVQGGSGRPSAGGTEGRRHPGKSRNGRRMLTAPQTWLRLARAAEQSRTALVVLPGRSSTGSTKGAAGGMTGAAAGLRLELSSVRPVWKGAPGAPALLEGLHARIDVTRRRGPGLHGPQSRRTRIRFARTSNAI